MEPRILLDPQLREYYSRRADEYDRIYDRPERKGDLIAVEDALAALSEGRHVLELACGTGYWTHRLSQSAASIIATDISLSVLHQAPKKSYSCPTSFVLSDAWLEQPFRRHFQVIVAGFWWSHVPLEHLTTFLGTLHRNIAENTEVVFFDNRFVPGSSTPITMSDGHGNTYQSRRLADGSIHSVIKNFPSMQDVMARLDSIGAIDAQPIELDHFWLVSYRMQPSA